ncbi:PREDICTED: probable palmitoyltransferase ZDHHC24 isoform X2 [Drosophila arizonae]|uniref:Palmitoyltransferase n=1 Tax=Drosophila arizonae TaxID=7263 RepID=A0ABM1PC76_DROAR|nr:PREDICTED: probable palmitoyltransferase ZDHHC24 isoform X1 [Drosophila arizonae]XP_017864812.1 PREDICTED: probable palmitoyltransferase ZDHHC24 isoform X2 [Drosophila arizonae]
MLASLNRFFPRMRLRRNVQLISKMDIFCHLVLVICLPVSLLYEFIAVIPKYHSPGGYAYALIVTCVLLLYINVMANMIACMIVDISVDCDRIKSFDVNDECVNWRHCKICNALAPPRSWHCATCGTCILTRDHHCNFTGCCIGHQNYRYFTCFLLYSFVLSSLLMFYNLKYFIWSMGQLKYHTHFSDMTFLQILHNSVFTLNLIYQIFSTGMIILHAPIVLKGELIGERNLKDKHNYDAGIYYNLRGIFGQHMHVAWIFPLFASQLPGDGYNWKLTTKDKSTETIATIRSRPTV